MCQKYGLGIVPWSPLAMGMLAGRYASGSDYPPESRAARRGGIYAERVTPEAVAVGSRFVELAPCPWLFAGPVGTVVGAKEQPGIVAPIAGPRTMEQLETALPVLEMTLPDSTRNACDQLVPPGSAVADFYNSASWMKMKIVER